MLTTRIQMLCRFSYGLAPVSLCQIMKTALYLNIWFFLRLFYAPKKGDKFLTFVFYSFP